MIIQLDVYLIIHISKKIIDLNKKQAMDVDPKQYNINITENLENNATVFFIVEEIVAT